MSLGNLLEMEELGFQVVPERDFSKPKPRIKRRDLQPVPKPRGRSLKTKDVDVEKGIVREFSSNVSDGVDNASFTHDHDQEGSHKREGFIMKSKDFLSSDSEHENVPKGGGYGKREKIVEKVEVYQLGRMDKSNDISENESIASIKSKNKTRSKKGKNESKIEILDETRKPKPKKRTNMFEKHASISYSEDEVIEENEVEKMSRRLREMKAKAEKDQIENTKDDEYLSITMQDEDEEMEEKEKKSKQGSRFVSKFKNLAKSFLKSSSQSRIKEEETVKIGKSKKSKKKKERSSQRSDTSIQRESNDEEEFVQDEEENWKTDEKSHQKNVKSNKSFETPVKERKKVFEKKEKFNEKDFEITQFEPSSLSSASSASSASSSSGSESPDSSEEDSDASFASSSSSLRRRRIGYASHEGGKSQLWLSDIQSMTEEEKKRLLGITIHKVDLLPIDPHMFHPVVRVTLMNQDGSFITKRRCEKKLRNKKKRKKRRNSQDDEESLSSDSEKVSYILPAMTQPAVPDENVPLFAPKWREVILFDERMIRFLTQNSKAILFFELMDFLPMKKNFKIKGYHGNERGWYKAAWAFLKLVGKNGILNVNQRLRLQLYKTEKIPKKKIFNEAPEVFQMWEHGKRIKITAKSLHVTVKGICATASVPYHFRDLLSTRKKQSILLQSKDPRDENGSLSRGKSKEERLYPQWNRMANQNCKVPNKLYRTLPASHIAELNLTVMGNVYSIKFSPCGLKLAAGLDNHDVHVILIFDIPSCELEKHLRAHHGLIYDLDWVEITKEEEREEKGFVHYLGSASADSTATVWRVEEVGSPKLIKVLLHPSFVYSIRFHPKKPNLVATGCYDFIIRIWEVQKHGKKGVARPDEDITPLLLLDEHLCYVNSLVFTKEADYLFSGDGSGYLFRWTVRSGKKSKPWKMEKDIKLSEQDTGINSLCLNATGSRLLVHLRGSCIKLLDTASLLLLHTFTGIVNEKFQIKSCFSPCGSLVLSGSEDACLCIWDAESGNLIQRLSPENNPSCMISAVDYHPFDYYVAIGLSSPESEPRPIIVYGFNPSKHKRLAISTIAKMKSLKNLLKGKETGGDVNRNSSAFQFTRGQSSEKFGNIVKKLDMALKIARNSKVVKESSLVNQMLDKEKVKKSSRSLPQFASLTEVKKKAKAQIDVQNDEGIERDLMKTDRSHRKKNWITNDRHSIQEFPPETEKFVKSQSAYDIQEISRKKRRNDARKKELEEIQTNVNVIKQCGDDGSLNSIPEEKKISKSRLKRHAK